ncbi:hypothetical protein RYD26_05200 [Pasteurellaceae bacterium LIM206]|nr:hypothetical protein [Pasteurellaceae bacterium LIM206]
MTMNNARILDLPDCMVDLESINFFFSSAGEHEQERLEYLAKKVLPAWGTKVFSLHQFAEYVRQFDLELLSAPEVALAVSTEKEPFAFWIRFLKHLKGDVLVQCELLSRERMH